MTLTTQSHGDSRFKIHKITKTKQIQTKVFKETEK